jgi:RimJ/RimL family protein N-acetyltransferase
MSWDQLLEAGVVVRDSPVETSRFGCSIERVTIGPGPVDVDRLLALIQDLSADVLVVRYDAARLELPGTFARSNRAVVPAGTLTYWEKAVSVTEPPAPSNIEVLSADELDLETVSGLVRGIVRASFSGYGNHYTANPLLDRSAALAGYEDWAVGSLNDDPHNVLVLLDQGEPIGLATLEPGADAGHLEILLAGLVPAAQGKRLYEALLHACERVAASRGSQRVVISTQVHNVRVQRAWARHGLRPFAAIETIHLIDRALLSALESLVSDRNGD